MADGFDLTKSHVADDTMEAFVNGAVDDDLTSVPGIGGGSVAVLAAGDEPVSTTTAFIGKFLTMHVPGDDGSQMCDAMWYWLKEKGVPGGHRSGTIHALAEKVNRMIPGCVSCL